MARFHTLTVTDIQKTIRDAVVVALRPDNPAAFAFIQGQYLTFRRDFDGTELRRNYSICTGVNEGTLKIGIKRVDGGAFSTWANTELQIGDQPGGDAARRAVLWGSCRKGPLPWFCWWIWHHTNSFDPQNSFDQRSK